MADPNAPRPSEVLERPAPEPVAAPDDFETRYRARLKQDTGHDDPAAVKTRLTEHQRYAETHPQYEAALRALLLERQQRDAKPAAVPAAPEDEDARIEELSRINPAAGTKKMLERYDAKLRQDLEQMSQRTAQMVTYSRTAAQAEEDAGKYLRDEFPEVYKPDSELHAEGMRVYQSMPHLQQQPDGFRAATEIAASRKGILPKSMRKRAEPAEVADDVAAQNVGRPSKRRESDDDEPAKLTARERQMAENMETDPKIVAQMKARRRAGQNTRVL